MLEITGITSLRLDDQGRPAAGLSTLPGPMSRAYLSLEGWTSRPPGLRHQVYFRESAPHPKGEHPALESPDGDAGGGKLLRFEALIHPFLLEETFRLVAVCQDEEGVEVPLLRVEGRHDRTAFRRQPPVPPCLVHGLGRSGSQWLLTLLSQHPELTALAPMEGESRYATHALDLFLGLSDPLALRSPMLPGEMGPRWWLGPVLVDQHHLTEFKRLSETVGRWDLPQQKRIFDFCFSGYEQTVAEVSRSAGKSDARYYCEKTTDPWKARQISDFLPGTRQLLLVRDFRDVLCSMMSFNSREGRAGFGARPGEPVEDFLEKTFADQVRTLTEFFRRERDSLLLVKYEDLMTDDTAALGRILRWLDLDASEGTIREVIISAKNYRAESQDVHRTSGPNSTGIGRHRAEWSEHTHLRAEAALRDSLSEFGYL